MKRDVYNLLKQIYKGIHLDLFSIDYPSLWKSFKSTLLLHYPLFSIIFLLAAAGIFITRENLPIFTNVSTAQQRSVTFELNDGAKDFLSGVKEISGKWMGNRFGLGLKTGGSGHLKYRFNKKPDENAYISLWLSTFNSLKNKVIIENNAGQIIYENFNSEGTESISLGKLADGQDFFDLIIDISDPDSKVVPLVPILDKISVSFLYTPYSSLPRFDIVIAFIFIALIIYFIFFELGMNPKTSGLFSLITIPLMWLFFKFLTHEKVTVIFMLAAFLSYIFTLFLKAKRDKKSIRDLFNEHFKKPHFLIIVAFCLFAIGFNLRWIALNNVVFKELSPDVQGYKNIALQMKSPYDTGMREPVIIWLLKIIFIWLPPTNLNVRLVSFIGSTLLIPLMFFVGWRAYGFFAGLISSIFITFSKVLIEISPECDRLEWYCIGYLLFMFFFFFSKKDSVLFQAIFAGISAGICCLIRLTSFIPLIIFSLIIMIFEKRKLRSDILFFIFMIIPVLPHVQHNRKQENLNDPFYSVNIHARYYRNQDFADKPGFISHEELKNNAYGGSHITAFSYIYNLHDLKTIIVYSFNGLMRIFYGWYFTEKIALWFGWQILFWIGFILMFLRSWGCKIILLMFFSIGGVFFLAGRPNYLDYRLIIHIVPFIALCIGGGIVIGFEEIQRIKKIFFANSHNVDIKFRKNKKIR